MLNDLIFLGQIPGTNIQITFFEIISFVMLLAAVILCYEIYRIERTAVLNNYFAANPQEQSFIQPAQAIGHISLALLANNGPALADSFVFPIPQDA